MPQCDHNDSKASQYDDTILLKSRCALFFRRRVSLLRTGCSPCMGPVRVIGAYSRRVPPKPQRGLRRADCMLSALYPDQSQYDSCLASAVEDFEHAVN